MKSKSNITALNWKGLTIIPSSDPKFKISEPYLMIKICDFPLEFKCQSIGLDRLHLSPKDFETLSNYCSSGDMTFKDFTIVREYSDEIPDATLILGDQYYTAGQ